MFVVCKVTFTLFLQNSVRYIKKFKHNDVVNIDVICEFNGIYSFNSKDNLCKLIQNIEVIRVHFFPGSVPSGRTVWKKVGISDMEGLRQVRHLPRPTVCSDE